MAQPSTLNEISQLILNKERELHQFHDLRCGQLEALVEERDQLLIESSRRFEKLKDDFEYNLSLIQARDSEMERLDHELRKCHDELEACRTERRNLTLQLEASRTRESDAAKKSELDRLNNKRLFDELKDGIEQMRWSAEEESRNQAREIDSLKNDIKRMNILREESLESQRRDLTNTFEGILQQREDVYASKERDIAGQIHLLDTRFEQLQTENTRLKNELGAAQRKSEHLSEELSQKEEARRQLQWSLDDERTARTQAENNMAHELQQVTLELSLHKDNASQDVAELKKKLAAVSEENKREKEFRAALEQRVEEVRRMAKKDLQTLETEIEECRALHTRQHREIASLREERDTSLQRACAAKVEADALDVRLNALTVEYDGLAEELEAARQRAREAEAVAARVQREFQDYRCQVGDKETDTLQHVTAQLVEAKTTHLTEFSQLKRTHAEEVAGLKAQWEETIAGRLREVEERHAQDMTAVQKQLADRVSELAMCRDALEDQKQERSTLEVRFAAQEAQSLQQQKEIKRLQQLLHSGGGGTGRYYAGQMSPGRDRDQDGHHDRSVQDGMGTLDFLPSPMFSEDLGAASFSYPASPVNTSHARPTQYAYGGHGGAGLQPQQMQTGGAGGFRSDEFAPGDLTRHVTNRHVPEREAFHAWGESKSGAYGSVLEDLRDSGESLRGPGGEDEKVYQLQDENERLKRIVKEMRNEVEQLHGQMLSNSSTHSTPAPAPAPFSASVSGGRDKQNGFQQQSQQTEKAGRGGAESLLSATQQSTAGSSQGARVSMDGLDREKFGILETRLQQTIEEVMRLREERMSVMDVGNKLRSALNKQVSLEEPVDETTASHLLAEVDHVRNWLTAAAPSRPLHPYNHTHAYAYDDPDAAYLLSDYELSDPQNVYGGVGGGGYDDYESEPVAQRNSHRYHQELQRQQRSGVSAATLLGTSSQGRRHEPNRYEDGHGSSSQPHRLHQQSQAQRGSKSTSAAAQEEEEEEEAGEGGAGSAGHRVWGSPVRRDKPSSRIPGPVDASESTARTVANNRIKLRSTPATANAEDHSSGSFSKRGEMWLEGHSLGVSATVAGTTSAAGGGSGGHGTSGGVATDAATTLPGGGASLSNAFSSSGNFLTAAGNLLPRTNSGRTTASQQDAYRRMMEKKKTSSTAHDRNNTAGTGGAPRKVMNYAKWAEHSS